MSIVAIDPTSGDPLAASANAIQRVLFSADGVHVYDIPPLSSNKGHLAAQWTAEPKRQIFTARLRILETATTKTTTGSGADGGSSTSVGESQQLRADVVLEDSTTGQLFAGAPYTSPRAVEATVDSSRFFAIAVVGQGPAGRTRRAMLGIGFEDRTEAIDFGIALQDAQRILNPRGAQATAGYAGHALVTDRRGPPTAAFDIKISPSKVASAERATGTEACKKVDGAGAVDTLSADDRRALFSIKPPSQAHVPATALSQPQAAERPAVDYGFDDGEFGEFQ